MPSPRRLKKTEIMIQNLLRHLGGIENYGIVSLCLFGAIFLGAFVSICLQKKSHLEYMSRLALDPESDEPQSEQNSHE
jgi:hypothetical protein